MKETMYTLLKSALIDGLEITSKEVEANKDKTWLIEYHENYPGLTYFENGLPKFGSSSFNKRKYTGFLLKDKKYQTIESWKNYYEFVLKTQEITKYYKIGENSPDWRKENGLAKDAWDNMYTYFFLIDFCESYIHKYSFEFNEENFNEGFELYYNSITVKSLEIDIYVPILFTNFEFITEKISDTIFITKMDFKLQLSRNTRNSFTNSVHDVVVGAATYAVVLKNWSISNESHESKDESLYDINAYRSAIEIVNRFFSALRISVYKLDTGFAQIIAKPVNWQSHFSSDLIQTYVVSEKNYPQYFENYGWLNKPNIVGVAVREKIIHLYNEITKSNYLALACKRLNKASINSNEDDSIIDICIALESLLTTDSRNDITYRLAIRAAILNKLIAYNNINSKEIYKTCKKIYDFRSSVVHGDSKKQLDKRIIKTSNNEEIETVKIAIEFLKHIIWVISQTSSITKPEDIDNFIF